MTNYNPAIVTAYNRLQLIDRAYQQAKINPPTRAVPFAELVAAAPTVEQVAAEVAAEAHTSDTNPDTLYAEAIEKVTTALAADALRRVYSSANDNATRDELPNIITRAAEDLAPVVTRTADTLTKAAQKLDPRDPLSVDRAIDLDTTKELKAAKTALADLSVYAAIHEVRIGGNSPRGGIIDAIRILNLPHCTEERYAENILRDEITNHHETAGTRTVRKLDHDMHEDMDLALINVARGHYDGITISLATPNELRDRWANLQRAFTRRRAGNNGSVVLR